MVRLFFIYIFSISNFTSLKIEIWPNGNYWLSTNLIKKLLIFICLKSSIANFSKKTSIKLVYLLKILVKALSTFKWAIWVFVEACISLPKSTLRTAISITETLYSKSKTATTNFFFPMSSTYLVIGNTSLII